MPIAGARGANIGTEEATEKAAKPAPIASPPLPIAFCTLLCSLPSSGVESIPVKLAKPKPIPANFANLPKSPCPLSGRSGESDSVFPPLFLRPLLALILSSLSCNFAFSFSVLIILALSCLAKICSGVLKLGSTPLPNTEKLGTNPPLINPALRCPAIESLNALFKPPWSKIASLKFLWPLFLIKSKGPVLVSKTALFPLILCSNPITLSI